MNKVYNTQEEIATKLKNFLLECFKNIRKTQLKIIPYIVIGMILAESVVASDIAKNLKGDFFSSTRFCYKKNKKILY